MTWTACSAALRAFYGPLAPPPQELFAFFVWDVVSARTLPARRDMAWQALKRLPALTPDAMFRASKDDLETALAAVGARGAAHRGAEERQRPLPPASRSAPTA